jgi:hypothetical protein
MTVEPDSIMDIKVLETIKEGKTILQDRPIADGYQTLLQHDSRRR